MKVTINSDNCITGYAMIGDLNNSIEIDQAILPKGFFDDNFSPYKYMYVDGAISINPDYEPSTSEPSQPSTSEMVLNQLVQAVAQLQTQISGSSQETKEAGQ
ncbi:hypothetical protein A8704_01685 [Lactiplantibacillus plantarum]|nr:hypothetical protein A8704_01685 [Lactiplantibacillus plantarum]MCB7175676.1 DUF2977 domain-containing protein [Lactiplantibacillus plantarum]